MKIVYFATGSAADVAADLKGLKLETSKASLCLVVAPGCLQPLQALVPQAREKMLVYSGPASVPALWFRVWKFLGFARGAEIICFSGREPFRLVKFLALTLRGRVSFSSEHGSRVSVGVADLLWFRWLRVRDFFAAKGPICIAGSAAPEVLAAIVASVRRRYAGAAAFGVLRAPLEPAADQLFDSHVLWQRPGRVVYWHLLFRSLGRGRFRRVVIPWTNENFGSLRWLAWVLPLCRVEIYNENLDAFNGRNPRLLLRHWIWRRRRNRDLRRQKLPVGVVGSASAYYLKKIVPAVCDCYPGARLHALLPRSLEAPASGLFDSVTVLPGGFFRNCFQAWKDLRTRGPFQCWIVPWTSEPYHSVQWLSFLLPLTRRQIYNELADGFPARKLPTLYRHFLWRLRDHLSFQIVSGAAGQRFSVRLLHLAGYPLRLLTGAPLLWRVRGRARRSAKTAVQSAAAARAMVELFVLGSEGGNGAGYPVSFRSGFDGPVRVAHTPGGLQQIHAAMRNSEAEFIGLLHGDCQGLPADWVAQLLEAFDERTAQVGPQIASPDGAKFLRGVLLGSRGAPRWNTNNAVRWHGRPEWLEVDGLPWVCVVIRRSALFQVGGFGEQGREEEPWVDAAFCRRLAAHGWLSLCVQTVTATHEAAALASDDGAIFVSEERRF